MSFKKILPVTEPMLYGSRAARPFRLIAALSYVAAVSCLECAQGVMP